MDFVDLKYINALAGRVRNFKQKSSSSWNFSCPICSDSHKSKRKARGYIIEKNNSIFYCCHNECGTMSLDKLFKHVGLYDEWRSEKYLEKYQEKEPVIAFHHVNKPIISYDTSPFDKIQSIASMEPWEGPRSYLTARRIPEEFFDKLFYVPEFKKFTNSLIPGKITVTDRDEPRLIIPFFDEKKKVFAYAGRSLDKFSEMRYINIILDESKPKIFGWERWDDSRHTFLVEGPFDSLFLHNGLASAGGDIVSSLEGLLESRKSLDKSMFTICYDNEPRSVSTKKKIIKAINHGFKVCIWPSSLKSKDINQMILDGISVKQIEDTINRHSYQGLKAEVELAFYCKGSAAR